MARSKKQPRPRKQKAIRFRLMRGIIVIILLTVLIPIIAYNNLPEWVYYLTPATRLWIATEEISNGYAEGTLNDVLGEIDKKYDVTVEIRLADGTFIYSTAALVDELPADLTEAQPIDTGYALNYETIYGERLSRKGIRRPGLRGTLS